jgi:hypothetical protein
MLSCGEGVYAAQTEGAGGDERESWFVTYRKGGKWAQFSA